MELGGGVLIHDEHQSRRGRGRGGRGLLQISSQVEE